MQGFIAHNRPLTASEALMQLHRFEMKVLQTQGYQVRLECFLEGPMNVARDMASLLCTADTGKRPAELTNLKGSTGSERPMRERRGALFVVCCVWAIA